MRLLEFILNAVLHHYEFRGKNTIIKAINKLSPCDLFVDSVYGVEIKEDYRDQTWKACFFGYEHSVIPEVVSNIPKDGCFIDIGANIGIFSLMAAKRMNEKGMVVCFEVNPISYTTLIKNIERNNPKCIVLPLNIGLSDQSKLSRISYDPTHSGVSHIYDNDGKGMHVITSIWTDIRFLESAIGNRDTYIKIDVEGMELRVISGIAEFLRNSCVKLIALEIDDENLSRYSSDREAVYDLLSNLQFRPTISQSSNKYKTHYDEIFVRDA